MQAHAQGVTGSFDASVVPVIPKAEPVPKGSVTGIVLCEDTHGPARGARVMLLPSAAHGGNPLGVQPLFAVTHLDGSFILNHVQPGEYFAIALAPGYLSPLDGVVLQNDGGSQNQKEQGEKLDKLVRAVAPAIDVAAEGATRVEINIQRGAVLAGRVLYSDGSLAIGIPVQLENVGEQKPASKTTQSLDVGLLLRTMTLPHSLTTDDLGNFRLAGIAPGTYRLAVPQTFENTSIQDAMMAVFNPAGAQGGRLTVYSGSTLHGKEAKTFDLRAGDTVSGIEITLPLNGLHTIKGSAAGKGGIVLGTASLDLTDTVDDSISFHTSLHADGEFVFFGVPEGSYNLKLSHGFAYDSPLPDNLPEDAVNMNPQMYKPSHAFAELTQPVLLGNDDIDNLALTPAEAKLPDLPQTADPDPPASASPPDR